MNLPKMSKMSKPDRLTALYHSIQQESVNSETPESEKELLTVQTWNESVRPKQQVELPYGFAVGSKLHQFCLEAGVKINPVLIANNFDLFAPEISVERYEIDDKYLYENVPFDYSSNPKMDSVMFEGEDDQVWGFDDKHVMFSCPRGVCRIERKYWEQGFRQCMGC